MAQAKISVSHCAAPATQLAAIYFHLTSTPWRWPGSKLEGSGKPSTGSPSSRRRAPRGGPERAHTKQGVRAYNQDMGCVRTRHPRIEQAVRASVRTGRVHTQPACWRIQRGQGVYQEGVRASNKGVRAYKHYVGAYNSGIAHTTRAYAHTNKAGAQTISALAQKQTGQCALN